MNDENRSKTHHISPKEYGRSVIPSFIQEVETPHAAFAIVSGNDIVVSSIVQYDFGKTLEDGTGHVCASIGTVPSSETWPSR